MSGIYIDCFMFSISSRIFKVCLALITAIKYFDEDWFDWKTKYHARILDLDYLFIFQVLVCSIPLIALFLELSLILRPSRP